MSSPQPFTTERTLAAPRALVYEVHTQPKHLEQWMGPEGFRGIHSEMDLRPGGSHHYGMAGPGGMEMWGLQHYLEVVPGERIVHLQSFSDKDRNITRHPMAPTWPQQMHATTTFEDVGDGKTRVTVSWLPHESDATGNATFDAARAGMEQGFAGMWAKLEAYLAQLQRA